MVDFWHVQGILNVKMQSQLLKQLMCHVQSVEQRFKLEKQREREIITYVRIIQILVIIFLGISQKKEKSGIQRKQKT